MNISKIKIKKVYGILVDEIQEYFENLHLQYRIINTLINENKGELGNRNCDVVLVNSDLAMKITFSLVIYSKSATIFVWIDKSLDNKIINLIDYFQKYKLFTNINDCFKIDCNDKKL